MCLLGFNRRVHNKSSKLNCFILTVLKPYMNLIDHYCVDQVFMETECILACQKCHELSKTPFDGM